MAVTKFTINQSLQAALKCKRIEAQAILESLLETMKAAMESGEDIMVSGFGKFKVKEKAARKGRNPQVGTDLVLRPRRVVTFKPSGKIRARLNGEKVHGDAEQN
jgi:integration host factor subunit alpha